MSENKYFLKDYGLTKELMNSLALFIYIKNYDKIPDVITIYNEWCFVCSIRATDLNTVTCILEHIRKLSNLKREELKKTLQMDWLIESEREEYL